MISSTISIVGSSSLAIGLGSVGCCGGGVGVGETGGFDEGAVGCVQLLAPREGRYKVGYTETAA